MEITNSDVKVFGRVVSTSVTGIVADTEQVYDTGLQLSQSEINKKIQNLEEVSSPITVQVLTSSSNILTNSNQECTLYALVFDGGNDITDTLTLAAFSWERISRDPEADKEWNKQHVAIGPTVKVSIEDVMRRSLFQCVIDLTI